MSHKVNIAIFISGLGSNMEALIKDLKKKDHPGRPQIVVSDNPYALGLIKARKLGITSLSILPEKNPAGTQLFERKLLDILSSHNIQVVCLAGFMRILSSKFLKDFSGHILNIHPSILPSLKGLNTHERALTKGIKVHGSTVHKVTEKLDCGMILAYTTINVLTNDTPKSLSKRLKPKEHQLYTDTLRNFLSRYLNIAKK